MKWVSSLVYLGWSKEVDILLLDLHDPEVARGSHVAFVAAWYILWTNGPSNNCCGVLADWGVSIFGKHGVEWYFISGGLLLSQSFAAALKLQLNGPIKMVPHENTYDFMGTFIFGGLLLSLSIVLLWNSNWMALSKRFHMKTHTII